MKAGEIVAAGDQVDDLQLGMQAVVHPWISWGECRYCQIDEENEYCSRTTSFGGIDCADQNVTYPYTKMLNS